MAVLVELAAQAQQIKVTQGDRQPAQQEITAVPVVVAQVLRLQV
jgi:hypothetical protein